MGAPMIDLDAIREQTVNCNFNVHQLIGLRFAGVFNYNRRKKRIATDNPKYKEGNERITKLWMTTINNIDNTLKAAIGDEAFKLLELPPIRE